MASWAVHRQAACWLGLAVVLAVAGCEMPQGPQGPQRRGEGPGGRDQPLALPPQEELRLGRQAFQEVLQKYRDRILPSDHPEVGRVRHITARLVRAAGIRPLQREINL